MKIIVETLGNEIVSDYCFKGYIGALNEGYDVIKASLPSISINQEKYKVERPMPIGSVSYMEYFFNLYDIEKPKPLVPNDGDQGFFYVEKRADLSYPVFVKPLKDVKKFTGFVAKDESAWNLYPELGEWDGPYLCKSPWKSKIVSEWRYFVHNGKYVSVSSYNSKNPEKTPSRYITEGVLTYLNDNNTTLPRAFSIDFAVLKNQETKFIEMNDMWAIGPYGCNEDIYFQMLKDRWNQIIKK